MLCFIAKILKICAHDVRKYISGTFMEYEKLLYTTNYQ